MKKTAILLLALCMLFSTFSIMAVNAAETNELCLNIAITAVNGERTASSVIVYTREFGEATATSGNGVELAVGADGKIVAIDKNNSAIPENGFVLSLGATQRTLVANAKVGDFAFFDKEHNSVTVVSQRYNPFTSSVLQYDAINTTRAENKLIIYRNKAQSGTNTWGYEAVVNANGIIVSVGGNNNAIPEGGFVISGVGNKKQPIEQACKLGYTAILDEQAKTITVSYLKENAVAGYEMRLDELKNEYELAVQSFSDIDHASAEASFEKLQKLCDDMKIALEKDNIANYVFLANSFENEAVACGNALVPYIPVETRALWLRIPTKNDKATVEKVVKEIHEMGFNSVCIEILFDSTTIMPMPEDSLFEHNPVFKGEDMLKLYTDEFHKYGIEVHAWMSCFRVGHDGSTNVKYSVAKKKPEWLNTDQNGGTTVNNEYGNAYFLNPALPEVREFLLESYKYILENYAIDGFQLDYVRYPENSTVNYGYDEYTKTEFLKKYSFDKVPTSSSQKGWAEWCQFRADFVTELVTSVGNLIKEIRPDVLLSCDVAPDYATSKSKMCQDTQKWLKEGLVDVVYPMAYGTTDAVKKWTGITVDLAEDKIQTVIGLRDNGPEIYREQIIASRGCNADGTAFFSYSQYITGKYADYIKNTVFAKPALCPSYNAKEAIIAQLEHYGKTVNELMPKALGEVPQDVKAYADTLGALAANLKESDIESQKTQIEKAVTDGKALAGKYSESNKNISDYLLSVLRIIEKTILNSRDAEKAAYKQAHPQESDESSETNEETSQDDNTTPAPNAFEKVVQVIFVIIMSMGILGLPLYFWLNSRKKRIAESDPEKSNNDDETEDINEETQESENE